jgi:hypothetical protein
MSEWRDSEAIGTSPRHINGLATIRQLVQSHGQSRLGCILGGLRDSQTGIPTEMSTQASARAYVRPARPANRRHERIFFGGMTLVMVATVLLGFRATYFPLSPKPSALASPIIVLHGTVFSIFLGLFLVQVALVSAKKVRWHMKLGLWLFGLAAVMLPIGVLAAANEIKRDLAAGPPYTLGVDPVSFSIVSVNGMLMFGTLMAASYLARRNPATHKRLALYAVISMMNAGSDRWPWGRLGHKRALVCMVLHTAACPARSLRSRQLAQDAPRDVVGSPVRLAPVHLPDSIRQDCGMARDLELYAEALGVGVRASLLVERELGARLSS